MKKPERTLTVALAAARRARWLTLALLPLIACSIALALLPPLALERAVNDLVAGNGITLALALVYFGLLALSGVADAAQNAAITVFGQKITHALRSAMCAKLSRLEAGYFTGHEPGEVTSRFVNDVDAVDALFTNGVISMCADGCKIVSILAVIWWKSPGLGALMLCLTPLLFALTRTFQKKVLKAQLANRAAVAKVNSRIPETIRNLRTIRSLFRQEYMEARYDAALQESYGAVERSNKYDSLYSPIVVFTGSAVVAVMMVLAALQTGDSTWFGVSVGSAVALIDYVKKVFDPLENLGMELQNIQSAVAGVRRIDAFLAEDERPAPPAAAPVSSEPGVIRFEGVTFGYDPARPVLKDTHFTVDTGESATLVGRTGAGKSTAFRLVLGLYRPQGGHVTVGGVDAWAIPDSGKRALFGYVEQSFRPVPGTVADQITLFDPAIGGEQIARAAALVGLDEAISALPQGYDTPIDRAGFSQGQLQLLSIARAVAADAPILLLDESAANLDAETERRVLDALERAASGRTVLSISHRLYGRNGRGRQIPIGS